MRAGRIFAILLRQFFLVRGSFARVFPLFAWVAIDMILWGFMTKYLNRVGGPVDFVPALLGAVLLWDFFTRVMQGVSMAFFEDVWSRNFLNVFSAPITILEYLAGLVLSSIVTSAIGLVVMIVVARVAFGLSLLTYGALLVPFLLVLFVFGIALGVCATAIVLRLGPASEWFVWPIPALISPLVGVFYPIATLPAPLQTISRALPPAYVFEALRAMVAGAPVATRGLFVGFGLDVIYLAAACGIFLATYRSAVRNGLIARYSAESVS